MSDVEDKLNDVRRQARNRANKLQVEVGVFEKELQHPNARHRVRVELMPFEAQGWRLLYIAKPNPNRAERAARLSARARSRDGHIGRLLIRRGLSRKVTP